MPNPVPSSLKTEVDSRNPYKRKSKINYDDFIKPRALLPRIAIVPPDISDRKIEDPLQEKINPPKNNTPFILEELTLEQFSRQTYSQDE